MKYFLAIFLPLLLSVLTSCDSADRGGVTLTSKPLPPDIQPPPDPENEPVSIISFTTKCMAVFEPHFLNSTDLTLVHAVDCIADTVYQDWFLTQEREILSANGQCLGLAANPASGVRIALNNCDGSIVQKWVLDEQTAVIRNEGDFNLCMEIPEETAQFNNNPLYLEPCHGKINQQWIAHPLKRQYLNSVFNPALSINIEPKNIGGEPHLSASRVINGWLSAEWTLEPVWPHYRIRNRWKPDRFLHVESGQLQAGPISPYWESALWTLIRQDNRLGEAYMLRNVWLNNIYIGLDADQQLKAGTMAELLDGSALWRLIDVEQGI